MQENNKKAVVIVQNPKIIQKIELEQEEFESRLEASSESMSMEESDSQNQQSNINTYLDDPFLNFVSSYSNYINDSENTTLDLDKVFTTLNETVKLQKPQTDQPSVDEFHKSLQIQGSQINELAQQLKQLPDSKLYQIIQNIEKLNFKLMVDCNMELGIGQSMGLL